MNSLFTRWALMIISIVWDLLSVIESRLYGMDGSAVGSPVAYALGITGIDPGEEQTSCLSAFLKCGALHHAIDIDIPDIYQPEFIQAVCETVAGSYHAAQIVTFSTFGPKQAIRDVQTF